MHNNCLASLQLKLCDFSIVGVGVIMIAISAITWRLTTQSSACSALFGLRSTDSNESFTRHYTNRLPPSYGRPPHPYATMVYPEFVYRPPPPSYQASMQEYRLRLLLLERGCINNSFFQPNFYNAQQFHHVTPPPTYRSNTNSLLRLVILLFSIGDLSYEVIRFIYR